MRFDLKNAVLALSIHMLSVHYVREFNASPYIEAFQIQASLYSLAGIEG